VAALGAALKVEGTGRGGKAKEEVLKGAGLAVYAGKRARKGKPADLAMKPTRVLPG
jgi:topoisomerase-4 subunit A